MIGQTLALMGAIYDAIGPGIILVAALPILLVALLMVVRVGIRRAGLAK
jgi:hypothetical protein